MVRRVILWFLCVCVSSSALAGTEFVLNDGKRDLSGGEVCFFRSDASLSSFALEKLYFSKRDVRCYPAATILDIPAGRFFIFGRHPDGYVTSSRQVRYSTEPSSEECYQYLELDVVPSAVLDLSSITTTAADSYVGAWVADTDGTLGNFLPSVPGEKTLQVPAGIAVVPMEITKGVPTRVGAVLTLEPGERYSLRDFSADSLHGDVITWIEGSDMVVRSLGKNNTRIARPTFTLTTASGEILSPATELRHPGAYTGGLLIFKNVPAGKATISTAGRLWSRDAIELNVVAGGATVSPRPLRVVPAALVRVERPRWLDCTLFTGTCDKTEAASATAILRQCKQRARDGGSAECTPLRQTKMACDSEPAEFEAIAPGEYEVELALPNGRSLKHSVTATVGKETRVDFDDAGPVYYGTVRLGKRPLRARLTFGTDDSAVSNAGGDYRVLLKTEPGTTPIMIETCDGSERFVHIPKQPPSPFEPFDIQLPDNSLAVMVRDVRRGTPLAGARVRFGVLADPEGQTDDADEFAVVFTRSATADEKGVAVFKSVAAEAPLRVCASGKGYKHACSKRLRLEGTGDRRVGLELSPVAERQGVVIAPHDPGLAYVYLLTADGRLVSQTKVGPDGTFAYEFAPANGYAVVVSASLPLSVVPLPRDPGEAALVIRVPPAATRRFRVLLSPADSQRTANIALKVDGRLVPATAFTRHQSFRGLQPMILNGRPVDVTDIAEVGPIAVILGPETGDASFPPDAIDRPELVRIFPEQVLPTGQDSVVFK